MALKMKEVKRYACGGNSVRGPQGIGSIAFFIWMLVVSCIFCENSAVCTIVYTFKMYIILV